MDRRRWIQDLFDRGIDIAVRSVAFACLDSVFALARGAYMPLALDLWEHDFTVYYLYLLIVVTA